MTERRVGQVSFNLRSGYERRLYEHANKTEHGEFSKYVKRLIDRDLNGLANVPSVAMVDVEDVDVTTFL